MDKETQYIHPIGIPSEESVGEPIIEHASKVVQFVNEQDSPLEAAKILHAYLMNEYQILGGKLVIADFTFPIEWTQEEPAKQSIKDVIINEFTNNFIPNSIERVAAYVAIIGFILHIMSSNPTTKVEINNYFHQKVQENYQINIQNIYNQNSEIQPDENPNK